MSCAISQEQYSTWSWFLVHLCKMISPGVFSTFLKFSFFGLSEGQKGKKKPKMKNNNYISHGPYFTGAVKHDFWYACVKWLYLQVFVLFFWHFHFWAVRGVKGQKMPKMKNNNYICHSPYLRNSPAYDHGFWHTCVKWWYRKVCFSFFWYFHFSGF